MFFIGQVVGPQLGFKSDIRIHLSPIIKPLFLLHRLDFVRRLLEVIFASSIEEKEVYRIVGEELREIEEGLKELEKEKERGWQ